MLAAIEHGDAVDDIVCPIITGSLDVNWDGQAASCLQTGGNPGATMAGNVFQAPIASLMESLPIRREVITANKPKNVCNQCDEYHLCRGACGVMHAHWDGQGECPGFLRFIRHLRKYHEMGYQSLQGRDGQVDAALRYMVTRS
jgi:radical SAM protein with 4Fe4S-binding SPASM domain